MSVIVKGVLSINMKLCLLICVVIAGTLGERAGQCPEPSGLITDCRFDPKVNCIFDSDCAAGLKCCSEGCGKVCKVPLQVHSGRCPKPSGMVGPCVILPNSCSSDASCAPTRSAAVRDAAKSARKLFSPRNYKFTLM
ncbi:WAP four-disulfide core domain protein 2-like [Pomacea canaliculata]|uniref:WAP four-disulfide core domain protein 2-like n=1 Tax=Pomacea canaliculata TaxID=400727 RepID=UPI000D73D961|nr:WAP four-disulfide core domain protein 2-like [Pomacea canaliculata]